MRERTTLDAFLPRSGSAFVFVLTMACYAHLIRNSENQVGDNRLPLRCRSIPNSGRLKSKNDNERNPEDIAPRTPNRSMRFER
jgi:hypothetical protein